MVDLISGRNLPMDHKRVLQSILSAAKSPECRFARGLRSPLQIHNFVVFTAFCLRCGYQQHSWIGNWAARRDLNEAIQLFSEEFYSKKFNFDSRQEEAELARNLRVLRFFANDFFLYSFRKRPLSHILEEDIFFSEADPGDPEVAAGLLTELVGEVGARGTEGTEEAVDKLTRQLGHQSKI